MIELMKEYKQLSELQKYQIDALNKADKNQKEIAMMISVSVSTISREFKRNTGQRGYRPKQAILRRWNKERQRLQKLNHRPRKTLNYKTPLVVFLLNQSSQSHDYWNCTSELNSRNILNCVSGLV
jgi:IS30 family transposase